MMVPRVQERYHLSKKIELDNWWSKVFWENRKLMEQGGYQDFFKVPIVMLSTAWKVFKYGVIYGAYFPVFGLNAGKYEPEITPYLDTFHAVKYCGNKEKA